MSTNGVRDQELKRLIHYAKGLGIKVTLTPHKKHGPVATWIVDGSAIELFYRTRTSKTLLIFNFIHELAHHMAWVYNGRREDLKTNQALFAEAERKESDPVISKSQRKLIYICERDDAAYREQVYQEVGIKIPRYKFNADKELDIWIYYRYYVTGGFPTIVSIKKKKRELLEKHKNDKA